MTRTPSLEHGCEGKINLGRRYQQNADRLAARHGKRYGVYLCPYCGGTHLTTKLERSVLYEPLLHITPLRIVMKYASSNDEFVHSLAKRIEALESRYPIDPAVTAAIAGIDAQVRDDAVRLHSYKIGPAEPIGNGGKGQFTPVTLTTSTQEAMERIATAPRTSEQGVRAETGTEGLVERVSGALATAPDPWEDQACVIAILATADWLDGIELHVAAARVRQEVGQ